MVFTRPWPLLTNNWVKLSSFSLNYMYFMPASPCLVAVGLKNLYEGEGEVPPFFAAACELVLGLLPIVGELRPNAATFDDLYLLGGPFSHYTDQAKYPTLTEGEVLSIFNEKALSAEEFEPLKEATKRLLHS